MRIVSTMAKSHRQIIAKIIPSRMIATLATATTRTTTLINSTMDGGIRHHFSDNIKLKRCDNDDDIVNYSLTAKHNIDVQTTNSFLQSHLHSTTKRFITTTSTSPDVKKFSTMMIDSDSDTDDNGPSPGPNNESNEKNKVNNCHASVIEKGMAVSITFPNQEISIFHTPWLWVQDPNFCHSTSGQRLRTIGQYNPSITIQSVEIVNYPTESTIPPPPPPGSYHPIGGIYDTNNNKLHDYYNSREIDKSNHFFVKVTWNDLNDTLQQCQTKKNISYFDINWLYHVRYDKQALQRQAALVKITKKDAIGSFTPMPTVNYHDIILSEKKDNINNPTSPSSSTINEYSVFNTLHYIMLHGAVLVQDAPIPANLIGTVTDSNNNNNNKNNNVMIPPPVAQVGCALSGGKLSHGSLYGDLFHVQSKLNAENIAYTNVALPPHQDLTYYESKPFLQLLHSISTKNVKGGESILIDGMAAAHEFQNLCPDLFEILCTCPATFIKQRANADMYCQQPHIQVASDNTSTVVAVHWSPPFEGPLSIAPELVHDYMVAYSAFELMVDKSIGDNNKKYYNNPWLSPSLQQTLQEYAHTFTYEHLLRPGEMLIFNNTRMLHGRKAFDMLSSSDNNNHQNASNRHLMGCYTDAMDTINRYRVLLRQYKRTQHNNEVVVVKSAGTKTPGSL